MRSRIERWATSCADTTSHQHRSGVARRVGRSSSGRTWRCWPEPISSRLEVLTWRGLVTYYVLFFIAVGTRRVCLGGITRHPDACRMAQAARNASMQDNGYLKNYRYCFGTGTVQGRITRHNLHGHAWGFGALTASSNRILRQRPDASPHQFHRRFHSQAFGYTQSSDRQDILS
jgi:hypothetical protein